MKKREMKLSMLCLTFGMMLAGAGEFPVAAAEMSQNEDLGQGASTETEVATIETDNEKSAAEGEKDMAGQTAFAQCEEYINIRSGANTDSEVVAKIYNNGFATILEHTDDWYKIESGNAVGYARAEYFATGAEAEKIAQKAAYNVAVVHPEELNIRMEPSKDTEVVDVAYHRDELEVVAYEGDWMKVALGGDVYGYVNAYYVDYKTYYPQAETIEEERARLVAEQASQEAELQYTQTESVYTEPEYAETEPQYTQTESAYTEPEYTETEPQYTQTESVYTEPEYTETEPQYTQTESVYTEPEYTETEPQYTQTEAVYTEPEYTETEPQYTQTESVYTEQEQTEPEYTETESRQTEASSSSTGQQIANYATQFIGGPYAWGGTSLTNGADCSGFVQSVFGNFGIGLARVAADQAYGGTEVSVDSIQPGDLLFYSSAGSIDHVGIYIGGGSIVHAANASSGICTSPYNYSTPVCARRYW